MESTLKKPEELERTPQKETIKQFLNKSFPIGKKMTLRICPLWANFYRLNFWERNEEEEGKIVTSYFVRVKDTPEGWELKNYDLGEDDFQTEKK